MLNNLTVLTELRIPGKGINLVALTRAFPTLKVLQLGGEALTVADYHSAGGGFLLDEAGGLTAETVPAYKKLTLERWKTFDVMTRVVVRFPTITDICCIPAKPSDLGTDYASWNLFRRATDIHLLWVKGLKSSKKDLTHAKVLLPPYAGKWRMKITRGDRRP